MDVNRPATFEEIMLNYIANKLDDIETFMMKRIEQLEDKNSRLRELVK